MSRLRELGVDDAIVCREFDRTPSSIIRMRTDTALMVALRAMLGIES